MFAVFCSRRGLVFVLRELFALWSNWFAAGGAAAETLVSHISLPT